MMKRLINLMPFLASFIGVVCAASLGSAQDAGSGDVSSEQAMHQRVEEGRKAWLADVELFGNYTYARTRFLSEEEALNEDSSEGAVVLAARGFIAKKGGAYRFRIAYGDPPNTLDGDESGLRVIDQAANEKFEIVVGPDSESPGQVIGWLAPREEASIDLEINALVNMNTPFCLSFDPISETMWDFNLDEAISMETLDNGHVVLTFKGEATRPRRYDGGSYATFIKEAFVDTSGEYPQIVQTIVSAFQLDEPTPFWTRRVTVKEWKDSGGISVPSVIRSVDGPARIGGEPQNYWFVSEWKSEDIGDRLPSDEDFAIKLDPEVRLKDMKTVPPDNIYNINRITDDDYLPPCGSSLADVVGNDDEGGVDWLCQIGLGLALIVAAAVVLRRRKKKRQGGEEVKSSE